MNEELLRRIRGNERAFIERVERNPWTHELRAVLAEADRTGDRGPIEDFVRRFKEDEARRWPKPKG